MKDSFESSLDNLTRLDSRYERMAYLFVRDVVGYTSRRLQKNRLKNQHLTADEICQNFCKYAIIQYGPMAYSCVSAWGIFQTVDIGNIIFNLISINVFQASNEDSPDDYLDLFNLKDELELVFQADSDRPRMDLPFIDKI